VFILPVVTRILIWKGENTFGDGNEAVEVEEVGFVRFFNPRIMADGFILEALDLLIGPSYLESVVAPIRH
jgi:hypothetical protein